MPFALIFVGLVLTVAGIQGTEADLGSQLKKDFTGQGSYLYWAVAIVAVGAIGYVQELKRFSDTFMALLLVSLLFANSGIFSSAFGQVSSAATNPQPEAATDTATSGGSSSSGGGGLLSGLFGGGGGSGSQVASTAVTALALA